jgi:anti-sigma regulatory factor (Ser/Thr protein kinase)
MIAYLTSAGLDQLRDSALLVVSELVTNAVAYSPGPVTLEVGLEDTRLAICVTDESATPPSMREAADSFATSGRGLHLVAALADQWGYAPIPGFGKTVWAQLGTTPPQ